MQISVVQPSTKHTLKEQKCIMQIFRERNSVAPICKEQGYTGRNLMVLFLTVRSWTGLS